MSAVTVISALGVGIALAVAARLAARDLRRRIHRPQPEAPQTPMDDTR